MASDPKNRLKSIVPNSGFYKTDSQLRGLRDASDLSPLDLFLAVIRDSALPVSVRMEAARCAAPYIHQKKPLAIEGTDKPFFIGPEMLQGMSKAEITTMKVLLGKLGVSLDDSTSPRH